MDDRQRAQIAAIERCHVADVRRCVADRQVWPCDARRLAAYNALAAADAGEVQRRRA